MVMLFLPLTCRACPGRLHGGALRQRAGLDLASRLIDLLLHGIMAS
jgi:hypothetical protein